MGLSSKILKRLNAYGRALERILRISWNGVIFFFVILGDSFLDSSEAAAKTDASKLRTTKRNRCGQDNIKTCTTVLSKLSELERMRVELGLDDPCEEPACEVPPPARRESVPVVVYQNPSKRKVWRLHYLAVIVLLAVFFFFFFMHQQYLTCPVATSPHALSCRHHFRAWSAQD
ncbi:hypothetical protein HPB48_017482 [Haemaphysalis longicornis]|uniref:Uncharacterized protein n=1 Tax=Haemaphysalis longicornis TaxID=44386 RepID=A0A9J6FGA4_HAELO|nr:hypothetical protein HPB48_017482 [Haemaphysalis longicornis]